MKLRTVCIAGAVLFALAVASPGIASARNYTHGRAVWFRDVTINPGDVIRGDLTVVMGSATCEPGALIDGNVRTYGGSFTQLDGCVVNGEVVDVYGDSAVIPNFVRPHGHLALFDENQRIYTHLAYGVIVMLVFLLFPLRVRLALDRVEKHPGLSAAVGTLALVAVLPIAILLIVSIVGIPLVVLEVAALFAALWIGQGAVAILVGRRLYELIRPRTTPSPLGALLLGLVVVGAAELVPVIGWAVTAIVWLVGLGAALLAFVSDHGLGAFTRSATPIGGTPMNRPTV